MNLEKIFINLLSNYTSNEDLILKLWTEVKQSYCKNNRCYHNFDHIGNMINELEYVKSNIINWDTVLFSVFYHDVIYGSLKGDDEIRSANIAQDRLQLLNIESKQINSCVEQILATKHHIKSNDTDTNYLLDADMSILGYEWQRYEQYMLGVRNEYSNYPEDQYKEGREKVLRKFLSGNIFHTEYFTDKYELRAINNIKQEIDILNHRGVMK